MCPTSWDGLYIALRESFWLKLPAPQCVLTFGVRFGDIKKTSPIGDTDTPNSSLLTSNQIYIQGRNSSWQKEESVS